MGKLLSLVRPAGKKVEASIKIHKEANTITSDFLQIVVESEVPVILKSEAGSGGTPLSGQLKIAAEARFQDTVIRHITLQLRRTTRASKPTVKNCEHCRSKAEVVQAWTFACDSMTVTELAQRQFYWSCLIDDQLSETVHTDVGSISYELVAKAVTQSLEPITSVQPLQIQRAHTQLSNLRRTWTFPPTSITCNVSSPKQLSPSKRAPVRVNLIGLVKDEDGVGLVRSLNHLTWQIIETSVIPTFTCDNHKASQKAKKSEHLKCRQISSGHLDSSDISKMSTVAEELSMSFDLHVDADSDKVAFDSHPGAELIVSHELRIEFQVIERVVIKKRNSVICSSPRHLQVRVPLAFVYSTEPGTLRDDEQLPAYQDQVSSPPSYNALDDDTTHTCQVDSDSPAYEF